MSYTEEYSVEIAPEDVVPDAVVAVINFGEGGYSTSHVFLMKSFEDMGDIFDAMGRDQVDMMGEEDYIKEYIDQSEFKKPENADPEEIIDAYFAWLGEKVNEAGQDVKKLEELLPWFSESHGIEYLGTIKYFVEQEIIMNEDEDRKFKLPGEEDLIAEALNGLNSI